MGSSVRRSVLAAALSAAAVLSAQAAGAADFRAGFETRSYLPWNALQYEFDRPVSDSFAIVTSPVRQGRYAARFTVRQGYSPYGWGESTQLAWGSGETEGSDYWYAWSTLFPRDWSEPFGWGIFAEWHSTYANAPPLDL